MDRDLASHIVAVGFHSVSFLESLIPILQENCEASEYSEYAKAIASTSSEVGTQIFSRIFHEHPDLEAEVESKIRRFGRFV